MGEKEIILIWTALNIIFKVKDYKSAKGWSLNDVTTFGVR
jgi:hypothetical protein